MLSMLTELCQEIRNWFDRERYSGAFEIADGMITAAGNSGLYETPPLQVGQYFRIVGSWYNDGIHIYPDDCMRNEVFSGSIWLLAIPDPVIQLSNEIEAWRVKNESADSANMSPYVSESFGGYSYSKGGGGRSGSSSGGAVTWKEMFRSRLNAWRKL